MVIGLLNGPNLNLLGKREPDIYGSFTLDDVYNSLRALAGKDNEIVAFQSNVEGELINFIHLCPDKGIKYLIFNPGAYTHTSVALRDAILATGVNVVEVHVSNIYKREEFRHHSFIAPVAIGQICGLGESSYTMALRYILDVDSRQS